MMNKKHFQLGIFIFLISFIIGYGGIAVSGGLFAWTGDNYWLWFGLLIYGFSWLLLGIGLLLAGKEGLKYFAKKNQR